MYVQGVVQSADSPDRPGGGRRLLPRLVGSRRGAAKPRDRWHRRTDRTTSSGQEISQKTAEAAKTAQEALSDGALTAKIKAKMALDDTVKALDLNIDTVDGVVTVTGKVRTRAERERALALSRETNGVKQVVDRITLD